MKKIRLICVLLAISISSNVFADDPCLHFANKNWRLLLLNTVKKSDPSAPKKTYILSFRIDSVTPVGQGNYKVDLGSATDSRKQFPAPLAATTATCQWGGSSFPYYRLAFQWQDTSSSLLQLVELTAQFSVATEDYMTLGLGDILIYNYSDLYVLPDNKSGYLQLQHGKK